MEYEAKNLKSEAVTDKQGMSAPVPVTSKSANIAVGSDDLQIALLEDAENRISYLMSQINSGEITTAERAELSRRLLIEAQDGVDLPFKVLGIRDPREIVTFLALREQAVREMEVESVVERILIDGFLGANYLYNKSIVDGNRCQNRIDEYLGLRSVSMQPQMSRVVQYLSEYEVKHAKLQDYAARNILRFIRALNGVRKSQRALQVNVKEVRNLNLADMQLNVDQTGNTVDKPGIDSQHAGGA